MATTGMISYPFSTYRNLVWKVLLALGTGLAFAALL